MRNVTVAATQMACTWDREETLSRAAFWAFTGKHIFLILCYMRKNFILHRETPDFVHGKRSLAPLASASAGINGFRRQPGEWHCRGRSF